MMKPILKDVTGILITRFASNNFGLARVYIGNYVDDAAYIIDYARPVPVMHVHRRSSRQADSVLLRDKQQHDWRRYFAIFLISLFSHVF